MSDEISPEIAAMLEDTENMPFDYKTNPFDDSESPQPEGSLKPVSPYAPVNLMIKNFAPVEKFFSDTHTTEVFFDSDYYKKALNGEKKTAQRLHVLLAKYLPCKDSKDRTVYRQQIVTAYWEFVKELAPKMATSKPNLYKNMVIRYGIVLPSLSTPEHKEMFSTAIIENTSNEPVYYLDEWFRDIGLNRMKVSVTDEAPRSKSKEPGSEAETARLMQLKTKQAGKLQSAENFLTMQESKRAMIEAEIKSRIDILCDHSEIPNCQPHKTSYTESQKHLFSDINSKMHLLQQIDKDIVKNLAEFQEAKETCSSLDQKLAAEPATCVNSSELLTEVQTVRQMAKMTVGRQGNHFPIFTREFYHCIPQQTGFREVVISILTWIESIDPEVFCRVHKNVKNRIVPFVILVPTYGDIGFCWEPFDRYNRITSRGRIVIPMYPKNLKISILMAVADLRWEVAKEKASYYWMEEGLTGEYYHYFSAAKLKGDIKKYFVNDYVLWMTKECTGVQKMDKEVRAIFWRNIPFAQDLKDKLKLRSLVYQELYQKDINRANSDGY